MAMPAVRSFGAIALILMIASAIAWAGSQAGLRAAGLPVFALCGSLAFAINWIAFVPAYASQTERYYDLMGSLTYLTVIATALGLAETDDARAWLLGGLVSLWAIRLGTFLFRRIEQDGADRRFDRIKPNAPHFLMAWTLQALWVFLTVSCALAAITTEPRRPLGAFALVGSLLWLVGFTIEVTADRQKRAFRAQPDNRDRFITTGIWAWSRHPNYFGEILLWLGIAIIALPTLEGARWVTLISPIFVYVLLTRISGVPMLEARARRRWGDDPAYREYATRTPSLVPRPPAAG
jgi:steroid 5-alpha reductase family enzyme